MLTKNRVAAAMAGIGAALVLAAGPALAATGAVGSPGGGTWRIAARLPRQAATEEFPEVSALTAAGSNAEWAFDSSVPEPFMVPPTAWERRGATWQRMPFPGHDDEIVAAAGASSVSNVWAFTDNPDNSSSRALRWNGSSWTAAGKFPARTQVNDAVVLSESNVWVFAARGALHWNGSGWLPARGGDGLAGGGGVSSASMWAYAGDGTDVAHWTGRSWTRTSLAHLLPPPRGPVGGITGIYVQSRDSVYAIAALSGRYIVLHYNGTRWSRTAQLRTAGNTAGGTGQIAGDGHGGFWQPVVDGLLHYSGGQLTAARLPRPAPDIRADAVSLIPGTRVVLAGGSTLLNDNAIFGPTVAAILQYTP